MWQISTMLGRSFYNDHDVMTDILLVPPICTLQLACSFNMLRIASCSRLLSGLRQKVARGFPASISTASLQRQKLAEDNDNEKIFEFRMYAIRPDKFGECMKIIENNIHIRTAHSKLVGFWITEMGGINEVYHLWEFGKFRHPLDACGWAT